VLAAAARPRLPNADENPLTTCSKIQVAFNNVARSIMGVRLRDRVSIPDLLDLAGIPSVNRMVVKAVSMEAWMCKTSSDGKDAIRNYVGAILFDDNKSKTGKKTRSAKTGKISVPLRGGGHLCGARGQCVERVGNATQRAHQISSQEGRSGLGKDIPAVMDVDHFLRDLVCLLRLQGCLLRDVGRLLPLVGQVHRLLGEKNRLHFFFLMPRKQSFFAKVQKHFASVQKTLFGERRIDALTSRTKIIFASDLLPVVKGTVRHVVGHVSASATVRVR
jgi:hypothetical protein